MMDEENTPMKDENRDTTGMDENRGMSGNDENTDTTGKKDKPGSVVREILGWVEAIAFAFILAMLIRGFIFVTTEVNMPSMMDTLTDGQRLIVYKLGYRFSPPKRGDIIVFEYQKGTLRGIAKYLTPLQNPGEIDYIKRVIGVPGDTIDIRDEQVCINGRKLEEPYVKGVTYDNGMTLPVTVPEDSLFCMGDNREVSSDSRVIGFIPMKKVVGKAVLRIWPFDVFGGVYEKRLSIAP